MIITAQLMMPKRTMSKTVPSKSFTNGFCFSKKICARKVAFIRKNNAEAVIPIIGEARKFRFKNITRINVKETMLVYSFLSRVISCWISSSVFIFIAS